MGVDSRGGKSGTSAVKRTMEVEKQESESAEKQMAHCRQRTEKGFGWDSLRLVEIG
jgi:hypothetical protein